MEASSLSEAELWSEKDIGLRGLVLGWGKQLCVQILALVLTNSGTCYL